MLEFMEKQKWRYLGEARDAISSAGDRGLESFLQAIEDLEETSRHSYSETFNHISSNKFVEMMVLDGCFIIQVLLKRKRLKSQSWIPDDPIFQQRWLFHKVQRDLLLLDNQIPFVVLECLFNLIAPAQGISGLLVTVVHEFLEDKIKGGGPTRVDNPKHLLHLLHSNLFPRPLPPIPRPFPDATQLLAAGVEFESSNGDRLDITFQDGVLKIPHFSIEDNTKSLFLNLSAFEQLDPYSHPHVTAYTFFMHCLINTEEDVAVLCSKGIIDNWLGSHQEVVNLFNNLGKDIIIYPNEVYLADVIEQIHIYSSMRRNAWRASCIHSYLKKPWAIFSLIAAIILIVLTFLQTFFAVLSYFRPPSSN